MHTSCLLVVSLTVPLTPDNAHRVRYC